MAIAICNECGSPVEIADGEEWGYCPMCENDQVELKRNPKETIKAGKKSYLVNCYTCEHNGQETCKGCRTSLVGDDEPYENWQLREDLESKDQKIADLEAKLAESEKLKENYNILRCQHKNLGKFCDELKQQLAEKELEKIELLKNVKNYFCCEMEFENGTKTGDRMMIRDCGAAADFIDQLIEHFENNCSSTIGLKTEHQDKISFALEQLEKVKELCRKECLSLSVFATPEICARYIDETIENQIEELKKECNNEEM